MLAGQIRYLEKQLLQVRNEMELLLKRFHQYLSCKYTLRESTKGKKTVADCDATWIFVM